MTGVELIQLRGSRTQAHLAEILGVHVVTVTKWETGVRPIPDRAATRIVEKLDTFAKMQAKNVRDEIVSRGKAVIKSRTSTSDTLALSLHYCEGFKEGVAEFIAVTVKESAIDILEELDPDK